MVPAPQNLPTRFPCWCRAVYSWGGESKRDLGFVEGDLIECLNAGDGSWWMGRLRRDKRMMGLFPSNFVQVLDDSFIPASRATSPLPGRSPSPNPFNPQAPAVKKTKPMRKPFEAYAAPDTVAIRRAELAKQAELAKLEKERKKSSSVRRARNVHDTIARVPSPPRFNGYGSRTSSPQPPFDHQQDSRVASPIPQGFDDIGSSPPPPPPPHRHVHTKIFSHDDDLQYQQCQTPHATAPCPPSPTASGLTPSPLRNAMEDIMSSLQDMSMAKAAPVEDRTPDPWSPEAFDQTYTAPSYRAGSVRPHNSRAIANHEWSNIDGYGESQSRGSRQHSAQLNDDQPPQLSNYVERMESRLGRLDSRSNYPPQAQALLNERVTTHSVNGSIRLQRPGSAMSRNDSQDRKLRHRKSAIEVGRGMLSRTFTTKSSATNSSSGVRSDTTMASTSTEATDKSLMSGYSAGGFSATSAGSLARKRDAGQSRAKSALGMRHEDTFSGGGVGSSRPQTPLTGISYHGSHATQPLRSESQAGWHEGFPDPGTLGGLCAPKQKKSGFFKKMLESAKTGAASARSSIAAGENSRPSSSAGWRMPNGSVGISGGFGNNYGQKIASDMGGAGTNGVDWVQIRRDINRSNSLSTNELTERRERCQMMDHPAIGPVDELYHSAEGDEDADGRPVAQPTDFQTFSLALVDKNVRYISHLPPMTNPTSLATSYVCRPYRSDVQRLRAIFTWVSEKIAWEGDFEGDIDCNRVIQSKRGSAQEVAVLVLDMCEAVGIHCEVVRGYLKSPGEAIETGYLPRSNHWWNTVLVDGQWRIMDCSLACPNNPKRSVYTNTGAQMAESWWFLARPTEICWTHIPEYVGHQHICPPIAPDVLLSLPCACPPFFKNMLEMPDYNTSLLRVEDLELVQMKIVVAPDVECVAEVEARAYTRDMDGDLFESGEIVKKRALSQVEWVNGQKRYTIKALLPGDEGQGTLKIYAGKRGLMHSIKDIPHPLALALPIIHTGDNPPYDFLIRHPTPHAQRHDLYVVQPQCYRLAVHNTFVFAIRQHPSSVATSPDPSTDRAPSPNPNMRPSSAMSMTSASAAGSNPSSTNNAGYTVKKPAKLAIQAPGGKILRLMRKEDRGGSGAAAGFGGLGHETDGGTWETIIKCGEKGTWRALVLADRSARWCVFAEWNCV